MSKISGSKKIREVTNKIQWVWIPRVIIFFLSIVFGWVIFWEKCHRIYKPDQKM